mmetsp:Transcript_1661/g.5147  ORF Transcript_1661/g.5147 Transcript_1661/m.5147 type:complete len:249 (+) Transcript_1661:890-1636(+)
MLRICDAPLPVGLPRMDAQLSSHNEEPPYYTAEQEDGRAKQKYGEVLHEVAREGHAQVRHKTEPLDQGQRLELLHGDQGLVNDAVVRAGQHDQDIEDKDSICHDSVEVCPLSSLGKGLGKAVRAPDELNDGEDNCHRCGEVQQEAKDEAPEGTKVPSTPQARAHEVDAPRKPGDDAVHHVALRHQELEDRSVHGAQTNRQRDGEHVWRLHHEGAEGQAAEGAAELAHIGQANALESEAQAELLTSRAL